VSTSEFEVSVTEEQALQFAGISGDWNPLHTDRAYAEGTSYRRPVLHGAYSAGLISRMAGMHIPGRACLLHGIRLKFVAPILLPATLRVRGTQVRDSAGEGMVNVQVNDAVTGTLYVEGSYTYGRHLSCDDANPVQKCIVSRPSGESAILVTGSSGGLGSALLAKLGERAIGLRRPTTGGSLANLALGDLPSLLAGRPIGGIIHCGWPAPDNQRLTNLEEETDAAILHHVAIPLGDCVKLAQALCAYGRPKAPLVLVGSTAAYAGRHNWKSPLYSLSKSLIPTLVKILSMEFGAKDMRCVGVEFDVIDGGMNNGMRPTVRIAHADRTPSGTLASPAEAADQLVWVLENASSLISGATLSLSGGALP
jgi:NAD(P)-dependent dehydrogenase (short-subunit alcohol dehydrogenase family)